MRPNHTLPRLYLDTPLTGEIDLDKAQAHYLGTVLRKSVGDEVRLFNATDGEWAAEIVSAAKRAVTLRVDRQLRAPYVVPDIRLLFAPIRKHRVTTILEKATELGVRTLQPILTQRTQFPKLNLERSRAQIVEAAEQTERLDLPELLAPTSLFDVLDSERTILFADEAGGGQGVLGAPLALPIDLLVGPEGGFTEEERARLLQGPAAIPVTLGPRILRADTAAISLLTLVQARCGDWHQN